MVENRKLFYAISLMLLTCCQIITMLPQNAASSESGGLSTAITANLSSSSDKSENKNAKVVQDTKSANIQSNDDSDFLIIAAERREQMQRQQTIVSNEGAWETQENDSRPTDNIDDLIFLDKRPINPHHQQHEMKLHYQHAEDQQPQPQLQQQQQQQQQHEQLQNVEKHFKFHHTRMDGAGGGVGIGKSNGSSNEEDTDSLTDTTYSSMIVVDDDEDVTDDGIPHEIELQPDINEEDTPLNVTPLDFSDFLSLIPAAKVKTIVNHYYHNDPEVQRAHSFMSSRDFVILKQHIIAVPEMSAFLQYLNNSGLDLVKFVTALTNLTSYENAITEPAISPLPNISEDATVATSSAREEGKTIKNLAETNYIEYAEENQQNNKIKPTLSNIEIEITTKLPNLTTTEATTIDFEETTTAKQQLNGLHGLVDSVLDVLPQDQILATFFDKLEANEQFSKLVDNIGSPEFAKILNNMQNSMPLRNLIFILHNNGIYVIKIVDSLKSYFFLGGF